MNRTTLLSALVVATAVALSANTQTPQVTDFIDAYFQGRYDEAVKRAAAVEDLGPLRLRVVQDVPVWIRADPALTEQRRAAAAAFLLELTHARLESDWGRLVDLVEFMCVELRAGTPSPSFERAWHRASVALAGRARARLWLLGEFAQLPHQPARRPTAESSPTVSPKHLMHALERFPDDPQLRLARIVAWTWDRDQEPVRNVEPRRDLPVTLARRAPPQREAITALQPLTEDAVVGAEALFRTGQIHFSMGEHAAALQAFEQAQPRATDPAIRYVAFFSAGRALEALKQPARAIEQYRKALDVMPNAESAAIALASLLFVRDDRESAVSLFDRTFPNQSAAADPGRLVGYGSFMHWPSLRAAMRAELGR